MRRYLFLILVACSINLTAQQEFGTYFFNSLHQSSELNPAFDASEKLIIALPSVFTTFHQRGISVQGFLKGKLLNYTASNKNQILFGSNLSLFKVSYKYKNIRYNLAHNYRSFTDFQFANPFIQLIANGNAQYVGGSVLFAPNFETTAFSETVLGATFVGDFSFGVNLKVLNGIQNLSSSKSDFELSVNDEIYQLQLDAEFVLDASFPIDLNNISNINLIRYNFVPRNFGLALDLGASYHTGALTLSASILDVGFLNWNQNPHNYSAKGRFVYDGVDLKDLSAEDFNFLDTIGGSLNIEDGEMKFNNYVPTKFYASVNYEYTPNIQLGALLYGHRNYERTNAAIAFNVQRSFNNRHAISAQYAVVGSNPVNLGLSAYTTLGPVQLYAITDNIIGLFNTFGAENANLRIGVNLVFGKKIVKNKGDYAYFGVKNHPFR